MSDHTSRTFAEISLSREFRIYNIISKYCHGAHVTRITHVIHLHLVALVLYLRRPPPIPLVSSAFNILSYYTYYISYNIILNP